MKKTIFILFLLIGGLQVTQSQIQFGVKGGINYNSDSFSDVKDDVFEGAESKTGFHAGIWTRFKLPIVGLYIRPELVYTQLSNEVTYKQATGIANVFQNKATNYKFQKIDIPVLVGMKFFSVAHVFAGPSFQYILDSKFDIDDLKQVESDGFSLGLQFGAGVELGKLGIDVRWERALSDTETSFVDSNVNAGDVNFDTRVDQIIVGLSYRF
ncbi:porin family protein [Tenacibaculum insulae]|uniref:porin family protein n=1 Tax=Tenacibaculum insulae TaxID=2029677 RepID=UPI003AB6C665